ncbi:MAG: carboxypeptidase regulatory-like domain-containing protein [Acidobacteria bacterium]|nr:carboxypeptidase regulatory-like domain-containing protein [Acidobacteriota bacterium]
MIEFHRQKEAIIFNLEDSYARSRRVRGKHPRPLGSLKFYLVGQVVNGGQRNFAAPLEMIMTNNNSGYHLFFGQVKWPDRFARHALKEGRRYVVRVESSFYQVIERADIDWPMKQPVEPYFFDLAPGYDYPFPTEGTLGGAVGQTLLRGALLSSGGEGIAGGTVRVQNKSNVYSTDRTGKWVLVFPDGQASGNVTVDVALSNPPSQFQVTDVHIERGLTRGLMQTALQGRVMTAAGVGIGGATIEVSNQQGQARTRSDGRWFYYFPLNQPAATVSVTARLPDGRTKTQPNVKVQPQETSKEAVVFQFP